MVHLLHNVKYDEYGDPILDGLTDKQKKYLELREFYKYTPEAQFNKAFNITWSKFGSQMDALQLDNVLDPIIHEAEMSAMRKEVSSKEGLK